MAKPNSPLSAPVPMTDGLCALVRAVLALPATPGQSFAGLVELAPLPSRVLELVAEEILESYRRREIDRRPTVAECRKLAQAAMDVWHRLAAVRDNCRRHH